MGIWTSTDLDVFYFLSNTPFPFNYRLNLTTRYPIKLFYYLNGLMYGDD